MFWPDSVAVTLAAATSTSTADAAWGRRTAVEVGTAPAPAGVVWRWRGPPWRRRGHVTMVRTHPSRSRSRPRPWSAAAAAPPPRRQELPLEALCLRVHPVQVIFQLSIPPPHLLQLRLRRGQGALHLGCPTLLRLVAEGLALVPQQADLGGQDPGALVGVAGNKLWG